MNQEVPRKFSNFLRIAAGMSILGALTTTLLIFLPGPSAADLEANPALYYRGMYILKKWILFLHPQFNVIATLGIASVLYRKYPWQIIIGTLFMLIWAFTEVSQQALLIDTLNQIWRPKLDEAASSEALLKYETLIEAANGISDSKYFLLLYGFGLGSLCYGLAMKNEQRLGRWIGYAFLFIGVLSLASFVRYYVSDPGLSPIVNWSYQWIYSYLQPIVRVATGVWLFQQAMTYSNDRTIADNFRLNNKES